MPEDRPRNFLQVLTGAAGAGLETLGKAKAAEKQRALPEALSIFSAMLEAERAQEARALNRIRRKEATIDVDIKGLQLQRILKLQTLGLDNPLELEKALEDIRAEGELQKTRSLMEMVEEETGVTTIPSGLKELGTGPKEKPPFTPYQQYQIGRTQKKEGRKENIERADRLWSSISDELGDILGIEGEDTNFKLENVADIDHALNLLQSSKGVPYALHPKLHEVAVQLQHLRDSYYKEPTSDEQIDFDRLMKKYGNQ